MTNKQEKQVSKLRQAFHLAATRSVAYWSHAAMRFFVRDLGQRMSDLDMSRADLARKIDSSTAYVTKVMRGDVNFTLETMTKLAMAVNGKLSVRIEPEVVTTIAQPRAQVEWRVGRMRQQHVASSATVHLQPEQIAANTNLEKYNGISRRAA